MTDDQTLKTAQVRTVLWQVLALNLLVAGLKIAAGWWGGVLSIVADGFHSLMDGSSNVIGLAAMRVAQAPPDESHPYGHRKAETLATLFIGVLLILAAFEILKSAAGRLFAGVTPEVTPLSFGVMVGTIAINLLVTVYEARRGRALQSEILLADSQHTRSDLWVSASVLAGLVGMRLGWRWLDAAVGLGIAAIIGVSAVRILWQAANVLMDAAPLPRDALERLALSLPGVESVERVRSRGRSDETYVDLHIRVPPDTPTEQAHSIAHAVQHKIRAAYPQAVDVTIHVEPSPAAHPAHPDVARRLQAIAHSLGGTAHEIWMHSVGGEFFVELHLEVPPHLTLQEAHALATQLEERGRQAMPEVRRITTHIEPMGETVESSPLPADDLFAGLQSRVRHIADAICGPDSSHSLHLRPEGDMLALTLHCRLPATLSIVEAHALSQQVEYALRAQIPNLKRVVVHVEPPPEGS
ncbi:MAG: cation-efflux pump [Caldilineae bacterium]|nr:MAG: cation-efflux pump [Caldilineae bacterium]